MLNKFSFYKGCHEIVTTFVPSPQKAPLDFIWWLIPLCACQPFPQSSSSADFSEVTAEEPCLELPSCQNSLKMMSCDSRVSNAPPPMLPPTLLPMSSVTPAPRSYSFSLRTSAVVNRGSLALLSKVAFCTFIGSKLPFSVMFTESPSIAP